MPLELFDILKLIISIVIITIPGYFWSLIFFKDLKPLERLVFGLLLGLGIICCGLFILDVILNVQISATHVFLLLVFYAIPSCVLYIFLIYRYGLPKLNLSYFKNYKFMLLLIILIFAVFMILLPHWSNGYFLPFHVDEWEHWCYTRALMESGSSSFTNPYTGDGITRSLEVGFHYITASLKWISGATFNSLFVFMPSIIAVFTSLAVFNIGERAERKFGLEAAFLVILIPTTCRIMGPSFYVPVTLGILFIIFIIWLGQLKNILSVLLIPFLIWCIFLIHPPTALACLTVVFLYALLLVIEKEYILSILTIILSMIPIVVIFFLMTRWNLELQEVINAFLGGKHYSELNLPNIWPTFEHIGIITWSLCIIGAYFAIKKGKTIQRSIALSVIVFIIIIGLYDKLGYGIYILYERSFLYTFLMVTLIAGYGLSEIRCLVIDNSEKIIPKRYKRITKHIGVIITLVICIFIVITAVPVHLDIPYYHMIDEEDYETFIWVKDNIESYRDENHSYNRAAIAPFIASPFSAVTGLYTISSIMSPLYGYELHNEMETFLSNKCVDTGFLLNYKIDVIYGECNNDNLTEIYPKVFLYSR